MLIKWGSIVIGGRGKLGGQVYSKNRGGAYARNNATPVNPQTTYQQAGRGILTALSQGWSGLTESQIAAWNAAVDNFKRTNVFGDSKSLSGKNLFTSLNKNLIQVGESQLDTPPAPADITVPREIAVAINTTAKTIELNPDYGTQANPAFVVVTATPAVSAGTTFVKNRMRVIVADSASSALDSASLYSAYDDRFGAPESGQKIFFSLYTVNASGQRSPQIKAIATFDS